MDSTLVFSFGRLFFFLHVCSSLLLLTLIVVVVVVVVVCLLLSRFSGRFRVFDWSDSVGSVFFFVSDSKSFVEVALVFF